MDAFAALEKSIAVTEDITKAHVKEYTRRTKSGGVATVKEHDDKRHPFSMDSKDGKLTFHDHDSGEQIHGYEGPFHHNGDKKNVMHTWLDSEGHRNFSAKPPRKDKGVPPLKDWSVYHGDGKHYNYDLQHDGNRYSISQLVTPHGRHIGYRLGVFGSKDSFGHTTLNENGEVSSQHIFSSPASAAKAAAAHYKRAGGGVYRPGSKKD